MSSDYDRCFYGVQSTPSGPCHAIRKGHDSKWLHHEFTEAPEFPFGDSAAAAFADPTISDAGLRAALQIMRNSLTNANVIDAAMTVEEGVAVIDRALAKAALSAPAAAVCDAWGNCKPFVNSPERCMVHVHEDDEAGKFEAAGGKTDGNG